MGAFEDVVVIPLELCRQEQPRYLSIYSQVPQNLEVATAGALGESG